ncbi:amidohydrolase family protein [Paenarthrobacter sp. NPDC056912]|uniref:metal-dependent hydrolase family protein n=1 Tax=Paenarthrobacter sp. NPDC056912 TaxID=3345965 RepID=UPI00366ABB30
MDLNERVIFRAGTLADVRKGELLRDYAIIVENERVTAVEPYSPAKHEESDAKLVDLSDHLVAPGLIDLHTHMIGNLQEGSYMPFLTKSAAWSVLEGVKNAATTLRAGFTTVRELGTFRAWVDCDLRNAINSGIVIGPRIFAAGGYVTCSSGGGEITDLAVDIELPREFRIGVADSVDEVRKAVRTLLHGGSDLIKVIATGAGYAAGTVPGAPEYTEAEIRAAVEEAAAYGKYVAAHAHGTEGALRAVRAGVRTLDHGSLIEGPEIFDAMLERGTYYVPTTYLIHWVDDQRASAAFPEEVKRKISEARGPSMRALQTAIEAGVKLAYGTDAIIFPHGENARQFQDFIDAGMSPMETLRTATINAADAIGTPDVGVIETGRFADLVAIKGLQDLGDMSAFNDIDLVFKSGSLVQ